MRFNPISREIVCKVVYYGPGLAGKTTNMQWVRDHVPPQQASELVSVDTHSERTLHFDWLALEVGQIQGVNVRFEFYTVPGQNYYAATRRQVLQAADGVVFVADSRREALDENIDSMNEMLNNLRHHGLPDDVPVVMQYNKQDLPTALRREQLEPLMNVRGWPSFAATAVQGEGVLETARSITTLVAERVGRNPPQVGAESAPQASEAQSWLISCYRCQTILEVPNAAIGAVYTCGVCGSTLEVTDTERGLTRAPNASQDDSGGYALQSVPEPQVPVSALGARGTQPIERPVAVAEMGGWELEGYEVVATLDESIQGRRARVKERASGRTLRAYTVSPILMRQPGYRDNLEPYVRMAGPIKHPNVLPLANLRPTHDSAVLLSVDPPDHEPLAHVLARRRALAPPHAMGLLRQLALALEEAARHGVVHGWLRPDVILVSPDGNVLMDELCLPKNHRYLVRELAGASAATEYYLAPEHLGDDTRSDLRSDIFSLGALLFRMITGEGLVTGYSAHEALHKVVANGPRPLRSTQAGVSRDLDLFYQRMVATERKDRFGSYREVIESLDKFGGGAKRQTLKLTGAVASGGGTGRTHRSSAGAHIARRAGGGGSGNYAGRPRPAGMSPATGSIRKKDDNTVVMAVVVICVLAALVLIGVMVLSAQHTPQPISASELPAKPPVSTATSASPKPPERPIRSPDQPRPPATSVATGGGNDTAPATAAATTQPAPAPTPMTAAQRSDLLHQIADLRTEERFAAALTLAGKLEGDDRDRTQKAITDDHDQRRKGLETTVANNTDIELIKRLVSPAQTTWGMPGDIDWANDLIAKAAARGAAQAGPENPPPVATEAPKQQPTGPVSELTGQPLKVNGGGTGGQTAPASGTTDPAAPPVTASLPPLTDPAAQADATIDQALNAYAPAAAQQALAQLDAQAPETRALKHKLEWWNRRAGLISRAAAAKIKMRLPNPATNESWDVVGADGEHLDVASPAGSRSTLPWPQFQPKDIEKIFQAAADMPDASSEDNAITVVMCLLANDTIQARLQMNNHKAVIDADTGADLESLMALHKRREMADVLARANDALKNGNAKGIADALAELKKDKTTAAALAPQIQRLEDAQQKLAASKPAAPTPGTPTAATQAKDKVTFDSLDDLQAIDCERTEWQVNGGAITNRVDGARIGRRDLGTAKSVSIRFQTALNKGTLTVDFRGAKVVLDLGASTYAVGAKPGRPKGYAIIPKLPYTLLLDRKDDSHTTLQFNNGAESAEIPVSDLSDTLSLAVEGGGTVSIDDLEIFREGHAANLAEKQKALKVTGWEPVNGAYLEAPQIVLPQNPGASSGIVTALRDNINGYHFDARGTGVLQFKFLRVDNGKWAALEVELPKGMDWTPFAVKWSDKGAAVYDGKGNELKSVDFKDKYTHLQITALNAATLATVPVIDYKAP